MKKFIASFIGMILSRRLRHILSDLATSLILWAGLSLEDILIVILGAQVKSAVDNLAWLSRHGARKEEVIFDDAGVILVGVSVGAC